MCRPGIYLGLALAILFAVAIGVQAIRVPEAFQLRHVYAFFASVAEITIMVYAAKAIGDEFTYRTSTFLFTTIFSRTQILLAKLSSIVGLGVFFAIVCNLVALIIASFMSGNDVITMWLQDIGEVILIYSVYAFCVGSVAIFISVITMNAMTSIIVSIGAFWVLSSIIGMVVSRFEEISELARYIGVYTASTSLASHSYGGPEMVGLLAMGALFTVGSTVLLERKDLR